MARSSRKREHDSDTDADYISQAPPRKSARLARNEEQETAASQPYSAIKVAENEFMNSVPNIGGKISTQEAPLTPDSPTPNEYWIIAWEDGPRPIRTKERFNTAMDKWEAKITNWAHRETQLMRHHIIDKEGRPLHGQSPVRLVPRSVRRRLERLIKHYQFEEEPDSEAEEFNRKHIRGYEAPRNRFREFLQKREEILATATDPNDNEDDSQGNQYDRILDY